MAENLRDLVRRRASDCCEYCRIPAACSFIPHQLEHIIAEKHHGETVPENLAWACIDCNSYKGSNIAGIDPDSKEDIVRLFHPRQDQWNDHFEWDEATLVGKTPIARATIDVLKINDPNRIEGRTELMKEGTFFR